MGFNFGAFAGGFAKKFAERIEDEEKRVDALIDDTWDEYTKDKRARDEEYKQAKATAEETIKGLNAMGYDIPLAAHLANSGSIAVQHAMTIAEKYGGTHDLNTLFQFSPDPSSKDFTTKDWINSVAGQPDDINLSEYISPSMKTRTLFTSPAEDLFREKVKASTAEADDTTAAFKFADLKYDAPSGDIKSLATLDAMLAKNLQKIQQARANNQSTDALIEEQNEILTLMKKKSGESGGDSNFSKQSVSKVFDGIRTSSYPSTAFKVDSLGQRILDLQGNEPAYIHGENVTISNAMNHPLYGKDPTFTNYVNNQAYTVEGINVAYVNTQISNFRTGNVTDQEDEEKRNTQLITQNPQDYFVVEELTREQVIQKAMDRQYNEGAVVQFIFPQDPNKPLTADNARYGFIIWTGLSVIEVTSQALTNFSHDVMEGKAEYQEILSDRYN